jgi:hypothetical protein
MGNPYTSKPDAGFLDDYSPLGAVASAVQSFGDAYERAQDRQYKRIEQQAQLDALKTKMARENFQSNMEAAKSGYKAGPNGELVPQKLTPSMQAQNQLKAIGEGVKATGYDDVGNPTGYETDYSTPKMKDIAAKAQAREWRIDQGDDTKDRREHERVITRLSSNPVVKQRLQQNQNLDNALSIITNSDHLTPQQIHEFQQAIRGNLGIKGGGGVGEREETYFKSAGLNAANWAQFLTGEPASLAKDSKMVQHLRNLAQIEQGNIRKQYDKALSAASGGHASMYARRPDLKADLDDAIKGFSEQMAPPQGQLPVGQLAPAAQGQLAPSAPVDPQMAAKLKRIQELEAKAAGR